MKLRILGSATSSGVPVIGCNCDVCTSADRRNFRTRTSALFVHDGRSLLIDASPDLRLQALWYQIERVDAMLVTHAHSDHIAGLDDLRAFNFRQRQAIPVYASPATLAEIRRRFAYIFEETQEGGGKPMLDLFAIDDSFSVNGFSVIPIPLWHGELEILGFRIGNAAYCTDVSTIPEPSFAQLDGVKVLVIDALRRTPHPTHFSLDEALLAIERIGPDRAVLTHLTHVFDHETLSKELPDGVEPAFDGMVIEC